MSGIYRGTGVVVYEARQFCPSISSRLKTEGQTTATVWCLRSHPSPRDSADPSHLPLSSNPPRCSHPINSAHGTRHGAFSFPAFHSAYLSQVKVSWQ
jgi:hypothetical protein